MSCTYSSKKAAAKAVQNPTSAEKAPSLDALRLGTAPTQELLGHLVDLPDAMRSKMETAFGADLSAVKLYESQTVADAGAEAVTQGSTIAFAPGMLDLTFPATAGRRCSVTSSATSSRRRGTRSRAAAF